jgi:eukaryotic-like serine/threonine-protein kinase
MRTHIGHYEIVSELGRGGMGVVYKAYEPALTRYVAIKELSPALAHDQTLVERFLREARSMASLNDPHIIQIYFIGQENNQPFFVMEFVDGESLSTVIKREGRLFVGDALKILHQSAKGLSIAHDRGVIHRDIKPGNLMLNQRGQVKIADFGIALANHDFNSKLTGTGEFVGTPGYLSPEVCLGKMVDQRSDIFALGIVLFEMLTGSTPFSDESPLKLMLDVVQSQIPDVREINREVDQEVSDILKRMLEKDPNDRYQNTDTLVADLEKHYLITKGGPLKLRTLPPVGPAATLIGMATPITPVGSRAPTPPPNIGSAQSSLPASSAPSRAPQPPPIQVQEPEARTKPGLTPIRNQKPKSSSGGKVAILLAVAFAGFLLVGGAWAMWRLFSNTPAVSPDTVATTTTPEKERLGAVLTVAPDATTSSPSTLESQPPGPTTTTAPDDQNITSPPNTPIVNNETVAEVRKPALPEMPPAQSSQRESPSTAETKPDRSERVVEAREDNTTPQQGRPRSVAVVTNGDPALMIPAQQLLEEELENAGFNVVGNPQNARFVIRVKSDRIGSQELSFYGQTAIVTTAYLSVKMVGPGGRSMGAGMRRKIDYTPLNAEDKVQQALEEGMSNMMNQAGE